MDAESLESNWTSARLRPCRSFCQSVEQRCPYLLPGDRAPAYPTQYAGEPTFLCRGKENTKRLTHISSLFLSFTRTSAYKKKERNRTSSNVSRLLSYDSTTSARLLELNSSSTLCSLLTNYRRRVKMFVGTLLLRKSLRHDARYGHRNTEQHTQRDPSRRISLFVFYRDNNDNDEDNNNDNDDVHFGARLLLRPHDTNLHVNACKRI